MDQDEEIGDYAMNPFRSLPRSAPGFWPTALLVFLALVFLAAFVLTAEGQDRQPPPTFSWENALASGGVMPQEPPLPVPLLGLILRDGPVAPGISLAAVAPRATGTPGAGYPGGPPVPPSWGSHWCAQANRRGCTDHPGHLAEALAAGWDCDLCPRGWQGYFAEFFPFTEMMLRGCWELDRWGTRSTHSGSFTVQELQRAEVFQPQRSEEYRVCWYERFAAGGAPERAFVIATEQDVSSYRGLIDQAKAVGAWKRGLFSFQWSRSAHWPSWVDNRLPAGHPENQGPEPPPPPPDPEPPPPQPEPIPPACGPKRLANCTASGMAQQICAGCTCPEGIVPAQPPYCAPVEPSPSCEECAALGYFDKRCAPCPCPIGLLDPSGHVHDPLPGRFCNPLAPPEELCQVFRVIVTPEVVTLPRYVPGIPSTGKLSLELVPQGDGPCP